MLAVRCSRTNTWTAHHTTPSGAKFVVMATELGTAIEALAGEVRKHLQEQRDRMKR